MFDNDLIGWDLDDVLEGYEVDFTVDGVAIDSCGEPRDPLLDPHVRAALDGDLAIDEDGNLSPAPPRSLAELVFREGAKGRAV